MSEIYVVTLVKHMHAIGFSGSGTKVFLSAEFVVDDWTTEPMQRAVMRDAAESFFYVIAEAIAKHEITEPLINDTPESGIRDAVYWGEYIAEDEHTHSAYEVTIFRHYFAPSLFDNTVAAGRRLV